MLNEINLVINFCQVRDMIMMFYFEFTSYEDFKSVSPVSQKYCYQCDIHI